MQATALSPARHPAQSPPGVAGDFAWTAERVEQLKALWLSGKSANAIAIELGTGSRSAVLGKVHRLGLSGRVLTPKSGPAPKVARNPARVVPVAKPAPEPRAPAPAPPAVEPPPGGVPFMATRAFQCRYAIAGDGMNMTCCGAPTARGSYCARHAPLIYDGRQTKEEARIEAEMRRRGA